MSVEHLPFQSRAKTLAAFTVVTWSYTCAGLVHGISPAGGVTSLLATTWHGGIRTLRTFDAASDVMFVRYVVDQACLPTPCYKAIKLVAGSKFSTAH